MRTYKNKESMHEDFYKYLDQAMEYRGIKEGFFPWDCCKDTFWRLQGAIVPQAKGRKTRLFNLVNLYAFAYFYGLKGRSLHEVLYSCKEQITWMFGDRNGKGNINDFIEAVGLINEFYSSGYYAASYTDVKTDE